MTLILPAKRQQQGNRHPGPRKIACDRDNKKSYDGRHGFDMFGELQSR